MARTSGRSDTTASLWNKAEHAATRPEYVCSVCGTRTQLATRRTLVLAAVAVSLVAVGTIWNGLEPVATACVAVAVAVVLGKELALRQRFPAVREKT